MLCESWRKTKNSIWGAWRKAKLRRSPTGFPSHSTSPLTSCGAELQWPYASFLTSFLFVNIHNGIALLREQRQGIYGLPGLPGNLSLTKQHTAPAIYPPGEGEGFSQGNNTTRAAQCCKKAQQPELHRFFFRNNEITVLKSGFKLKKHNKKRK